MKELQLIDGFLVDDDGVRFERTEPPLVLEHKITGQNVHLTPEKCIAWYGQQILDLKKEGKLPKGWSTFNAYLARQEPIDESDGPYRLRTKITTEFYFLGEE